MKVNFQYRQIIANYLTVFYCSKLERKDKENEKHRRKNFNGRRRNQAVTKQKKKAHQSTETGRTKEKR